MVTQGMRNCTSNLAKETKSPTGLESMGTTFVLALDTIEIMVFMRDTCCVDGAKVSNNIIAFTEGNAFHS